jgi:hypothetical protein
MAATLHRVYEEAVAIMYGMNADDAGPDDDMELAGSLKRLLEEHPNLLIYNHRREQTNRQSRREHDAHLPEIEVLRVSGKHR